MEKLLENFILPINIAMHEDSRIENLDSSVYNGKSFVSTFDVVCVGNMRFFYFNKNGKPDVHVLFKKRYPVPKTNLSVPFIECNEMNWIT